MIIKNLGPVMDLDVQLNKQTIFLGENNVGKTYVSYLIYGVFEQFDYFQTRIRKEYVHSLLENKYSTEDCTLIINVKETVNEIISKVVKNVNKRIPDLLPKIFNLPTEFFRNTSIQVFNEDFDIFINRIDYLPTKRVLSLNTSKYSGKVQMEDLLDGQIILKILEFVPNYSTDILLDESDDLINIDLDPAEVSLAKKSLIEAGLDLIIFGGIFDRNTSLYIPAERNGINVFKDELLTKRSNNTFDLLNNAFTPSEETILYPLPISDYMKYLNNINFLIKRELSSIYKKHLGVNKLDRNIGKNFTKNVLKGEFVYDLDSKSFFFEQNSNKDFKIPLKSSSSSTKSLFGLHYYITERYQPGDILFIDEPEMNLDPLNQIAFAKILFDLTKSGVHLIISTHSDYLVRSITNELLKEKITDQTRNENPISTYYFSSKGITQLENLPENDFIENFDGPNMFLQNEFIELIEKLDDSNEGE